MFQQTSRNSPPKHGNTNMGKRHGIHWQCPHSLPQVLVKEAAEKLQTVQDTVAKVRWTSLGDEGNMDQVWGFYDGNVGENGDETMVWKWEFYWEATFADGIRLRISKLLFWNKSGIPLAVKGYFLGPKVNMFWKKLFWILLYSCRNLFNWDLLA